MHERGRGREMVFKWRNGDVFKCRKTYWETVCWPSSIDMQGSFWLYVIFILGTHSCPDSSPKDEASLLSPFYICWAWSLKGLSNWLKVVWLVGDGTQIYTKGFWLQSSCSSLLTHALIHSELCYWWWRKLKTVPTWGVVAGMSIWSQEERVHGQYGRGFFKYWVRRSQWMEAMGR